MNKETRKGLIEALDAILATSPPLRHRYLLMGCREAINKGDEWYKDNLKGFELGIDDLKEQFPEHFED